jgi:hypothetical protein
MIDLKSLSKNSPKPPRIVIYGDGGIGKTTFASGAPDHIFILTEDGLGDIEAPGLPVDENGKPRRAVSFGEVTDALNMLGEQDHDFKTVVIDSLDWLEPLIWKATCERINATSIESPGYGRGYIEAGREWRDFFDLITDLRDIKGMTIIMLAHDAIARVEDPIHPAYDTHGIKLHKRAAALSEEFCDIMGYAAHKTLVRTEDGGFGDKRRNRALPTGERILYLSGTAAYTAKNRYSMPDEVPLVWDEFAKYLPGAKKKE